MLPIRNILCPTDFSEPSFKGVAAADELAAHFAARLVLITVVTPIQPVVAVEGTAFMTEDFHQQMVRQATAALEKVAAERITAGVQTKQVVAHGTAADQIIALTEQEGADLLVIATHGWTGWRRFVFGSVTEKVIRQARCPVLTVPGPSAD